MSAAVRRPTHLRPVPPPPPRRRAPPPEPGLRLAPARDLPRPPMSHFYILSVLLHVIAIAMFGAPSAGSPEGRAMWGSLRVTLRPPAPEPVPLRMDTELARPQLPEMVKPRPLPRVQSFPPLLDRIKPPELKMDKLPALRVPMPMPMPEPPAAPAPAPEPLLAPPVDSAPLEAPVVPVPIPPPSVESAAPPRVEPMLRPVEVPPLEPTPAAPPQPSKPIERELAAPPAPAAAPIKPPLPGPSKPYDPTAPALDLDAIRARAGEIARQGSGQRAPLAFPMPPIPEKKSKIESALEKARKPDCREAYKDLGLAAIVPLIANEFGEGNCRW